MARGTSNPMTEKKAIRLEAAPDNTSRRGFLGMCALSGAGAAAALGGCASAKTAELATTRRVKFCVFADIHYNPGVCPHASKEWLGRILERAEKENVDFIIHCGDFCHHPARDKDYVNFYNDFHLPTYHVIGNHDDDGNSHAETLEAYRLKSGHYFFDRNGYRFIVTDPNYVKYADGRVEHYSNGNYYKKKPGGLISYVPPEQLEWLKETIGSSPYPCVVFSHQSFERGYGSSCSNPEEVRRIFDAANAANPGRVPFVINGHSHCDFVRVLEQIVYMEVNSANFQWLGSKFNHSSYPEEFCRNVSSAPHIATVNDPLSAIVTLDGSGLIDVDGMKSSFYMGISPKQMGYKGEVHRPFTSDIQSFAMRLMSPRRDNA